MDLIEARRREKWMRVLDLAAPIGFLIVCAEAVTSILVRWPYQFTGQGDPARMLGDFLYLGTLLAPPLPLLLAFGASAFLVRRRDELGRMANVGLAVTLAVMLFGSLGEAFAAPTPDIPRAVQIGGGVLNTLLFTTLLGLALGALAERAQSTMIRRHG